MTDTKIPEPLGLAMRIAKQCVDRELETFDLTKAEEIIRADREAARAPFEALLATLDLEVEHASFYATVDPEPFKYNQGVEWGTNSAKKEIAKQLRALLPPHQPPKSEGDGEAGGQP